MCIRDRLKPPLTTSFSQRTATDGSSRSHGARTVTPTANQHYRKQTFEEEYVDLLRLSDVEFDKSTCVEASWRPFRAPLSLGPVFQGLRSFHSLTPGYSPCTPPACETLTYPVLSRIRLNLNWWQSNLT